ncbi:hypothetical protein LCGC14_1777600, partial [marine sediment metagenome]
MPTLDELYKQLVDVKGTIYKGNVGYKTTAKLATALG